MRRFQSLPMPRRVRFLIRRLRRNAKGVAAIEFAMIVPLLFMFFIGTLELGNAITIDRRVSQVASSVADLVSRTGTISDTQLDFISQRIARSMMSPYSDTPLKISIVSVHAAPDDATDTTVCWSYENNGGTAYGQGSSYTIPTGLMNAGTSVIVGEVTYDYTPLIFSQTTTQGLTRQQFTPGAYTITEKFYLSPRSKSCVSRNTDNSCLPCFAP